MSIFSGGSSGEAETDGSEEIAGTIRELESSLNKLSTINRAMWRVIERHVDVSMDELETEIQAIEQEDERIEGTALKKAKQCGKCGRPVSAKTKKCQYCGEPLSDLDVFDQV